MSVEKGVGPRSKNLLQRLLVEVAFAGDGAAETWYSIVMIDLTLEFVVVREFFV